jgi:hypothetical protein
MTGALQSNLALAPSRVRSPSQARLDSELHAALERRARADQMTSSEIVREALHEYLSA